MALELVKENIDCEELMAENGTDTMVKGEYLVPDIKPDLLEILMLESRPKVTNKEILQDRVMIEGIIDYNIIYVSKDEAKSICSLTYSSKFSDYVEAKGVDHSMLCNAECVIEHMECSIINERKIGINGVLNIKSSIYKRNSMDIIKDITGLSDIQYLRSPSSIDRIKNDVNVDLIAKSNIKISQDKPQLDSILRCDVFIHKRDVKVTEGRISYSAFAKIDMLYRGFPDGELNTLSDDVIFTKDLELPDVNSSMDNITDFMVDAEEIDIKEDDLGEKRIVDIEILVKAFTKLMYKDNLELIEDVYCPNVLMEVKKNKFNVNVMQGRVNTEAIVKCNMELAGSRAKDIIFKSARVILTDKKVMEDKVSVEGIVYMCALYYCEDDSKGVKMIQEEVPFSTTLDLRGCKIDMGCNALANLETLEAEIEGNTIGMRAMVSIYAIINYVAPKEFLVDVTETDNEVPKMKCSIGIYVVQTDDTLWKIAKKYNTTVENLAKINNIEDPNSINIGQKLIIPGRAIM